jgi:tetratricopeptide (TPR) repeat protein
MRTRALFLGCCLVCLGLLLAAYSNFFQNEFHFDDSHVLVNNLYIRSIGNAPKYFTDALTFSSLPRNCTYRPLVPLALSFDYYLAGGLSPAVFHVSQLVTLVLLGLALYFFYRKIMDRCLAGPWNGYLALFAASLFCLHTVNTETMNLMHARSEILSALGLVGAFLVYFGMPRLRRTGIYLFPVILGALAKTPAVLFGPLLFVWAYLEPAKSARTVRAEKPTDRLRVALLAAAPAILLAAVLYIFIEKIMAPPAQTYGGGDRYQYALTQTWVWVHYLRLFVLPTGLTADTDLGLFTTLADPRVFAGLAVIALLAVIGVVCARSRRAWPVAFGLAWFALGLTPTSTILPLAEPMNEHRIFLPYIGLILAVVWGARLAAENLTARSRLGTPVREGIAAALCGGILLGHAAGVHARNETWRTSETLWSDVTTKSPGNGRAWMNYGLVFMERGEFTRAKECYERAEKLTPDYSYLLVNIGILEGAMDRPVEAERRFLRALELQPALPSSHYYYARWLVGQGRAPAAIHHLEETIRLSPAHEEARRYLLDLRAAQGSEDVVRRLARDYAAAFPDDLRSRVYPAGGIPMPLHPATYDTYFQHGVRLGTKKEYVDSALAYRAALQLNPTSTDALNNLGWTLGTMGFYKEAVPFLEEAVRLKPDSKLARNNLAWVKSRIG